MPHSTHSIIQALRRDIHVSQKNASTEGNLVEVMSTILLCYGKHDILDHPARSRIGTGLSSSQKGLNPTRKIQHELPHLQPLLLLELTVLYTEKTVRFGL